MAPVKLSEAKSLFEKIKKESASLKKTDVVLCPPFVFLSELGKRSSPKCQIGAQNGFFEAEGAHTGEISLHMLLPFNISHVILGHSERRAGNRFGKVSKRFRYL